LPTAFALSPPTTQLAIVVRGALCPLLFPSPTPETAAFIAEASTLVPTLDSEALTTSLQGVYSDVFDAASWQQVHSALQALAPASARGTAHGLKWQTQQATQADGLSVVPGLAQVGIFGMPAGAVPGFGSNLTGLTGGVPQLSWGGAAATVPRSAIQRQREEEEEEEEDDWTKALSSDSN
jgi:hypothetical protein